MPVNLTVFRRTTGGGLGEQVATSGPYVEQISGVSTGRVKLDAGVYILVPSTYERGEQADWVLDMWADSSFSAEMD